MYGDFNVVNVVKTVGNNVLKALESTQRLDAKALYHRAALLLEKSKKRPFVRTP